MTLTERIEHRIKCAHPDDDAAIVLKADLRELLDMVIAIRSVRKCQYSHCDGTRFGYDPGEIQGQGTEYCLKCHGPQIPIRAGQMTSVKEAKEAILSMANFYVKGLKHQRMIAAIDALIAAVLLAVDLDRQVARVPVVEEEKERLLRVTDQPQLRACESDPRVEDRGEVSLSEIDAVLNCFDPYEDGNDAAELLRRIASAMRAAKERGARALDNLIEGNKKMDKFIRDHQR